ncbi:hypothetical protein Bca52824_004827 [Brassica carinata]|uniref:Uncharacterized protein n=1 Tax=Brassica carinata TaxID=52824 RepID=A0A8X7WQG9_BRACI|nr:hypothetical protein Bca52824_004827 [Brassica carinata]
MNEVQSRGNDGVCDGDRGGGEVMVEDVSVDTMVVVTVVVDMVEETVDTAVEAVVVMEAMVEDMSVDTMVVVGGGGYSSGGDGCGYDGGGYGGGGRREGGGYGGGDGGDHRNRGCGVRCEGSYSGGSPAIYSRSKDETFSELEHELNGGGCGCDGRYF